MTLKYNYVKVGIYRTQCVKCGEYTDAPVWFCYDIEQGKLSKTFSSCTKCGATIYEKEITDEAELDINIKKFPEPLPLSDETKFKSNPFKPTVKCPYCGSTSTKKISTLSRMGSFATFGFAGKKVGKQWHCNNCKSDF